METVEIGKAVLIGSSYGGYVAQFVARRHPEKVEAVCQFSTVGLSERTLNGLRSKYRDFRKMLPILKTVPYSWLKPVMVRSSMKHITNATPEEYAYLEDMFRSIYKDYTKEFDLHMTGLLKDILEQPPCIPEEYAYLDGRALLILPEGDSSFTPEMQQDLISLIPNPTVKQMDAGHLER